MAFMHSCIHISVDRCVDYFLFLLDCCMHFVVAVFLDCFILYKCPACDQNFSAFPRVTSMDHKKVSCLHFDLNSEPENSYYSEIDMSCPVDLNSGPESSYASSQNQQTNSYLPIDLNLLPEKSFLRYDINWVLEKVYRPSPNQQSNSSFRSKDDNQLFLSKKKRFVAYRIFWLMGCFVECCLCLLLRTFSTSACFHQLKLFHMHTL